MGIRERQKIIMDNLALAITKWIGSTGSLLLHTVLFIGAFLLADEGLISFDKMLLILTTIVSLEAIYLSIFIQMSLNMSRQNIEFIQEDLEEISEDIEEIQKDVDEIQEDVEEISEDVEEISEDVEEIQKDVEEIQEDVEEISEDVEGISEDVEEISEDVEEIQENRSDNNTNNKEAELLVAIQATLVHLQKEIEQLKSSHK
jgi:methyl-accepting chemotaxis protein